MAGPQFEKTSPRSSNRSDSSSPRPRLSCSAKVKGTKLEATKSGPTRHNQNAGLPKLEHKQTALVSSFLNQVPVTPLKIGKRRHNTFFSHSTDKRDYKFKKISSQSPVKEMEVALKVSSPVFIDETCDASLAVPKVFAIPPNPSLLPNPPQHWVKGNESHCLASRQQCRVVTQCLMSHLTSTGILIAA